MLPRCSKTGSLYNSLSRGTLYVSSRNVHWFHDPKMAGGERDPYELYNRQKEFGHGEITDHDRYPHLYWELHRGRTVIQRVVSQWGYSKDLKPEKAKRDLEKYRYFAKLDSLNFLELNRQNYSYLDSDANNAVGYITDEEDDEIESHKDYGKTYKMSSSEYRQLVLTDKCMGRPVYEWQVPYELDVAFGYRDISTAVDILGTEETNENINMKWEKIKQDGKGILFKNHERMQELLLVNINDSVEEIKHFEPNTVVLQCGAERNLNSVKSTFSSTDSTDVYGCLVSLTWSFVYLLNLPSSFVIQALTLPTIFGLNSIFLYRTFLDTKEFLLKKILKSCRKNKISIVFGDWLLDDYDERLNQIAQYDNISLNINDPKNIKLLTSNLNDESKLKKAINDVSVKLNEFNTDRKMKKKTRDDVRDDNWMVSFRDTVNNKRIDLLSQVLHNCEGDRILMCVEDVDDIPADLVVEMLSKRLQGITKIEKPAFKYDEYYERVQVDI